MSKTIKVRLRSSAFHNGVRLRPGAIVDFNIEDLLDGRLPSWAEIIPGETDLDVLAKHINAGDARGIAESAKRAAEREAKKAKEAADKAAAEAEKAAKAEKIAADAEKAAKVK